MINKQEVRVGNKVAVDNGRYIATVLTIRQSVMDVMYVDKGPYAPPLPEDGIHGYASWAYEHAEPIRITPELLEKVGFKNNHLFTTKFRFQCFDGYAYVRMSASTDSVYIENIKYLHQLQNLYYSLMGEELNIEL